jgi:bacillithiol biosynthesis cysteine-adding enzyme BshC
VARPFSSAYFAGEVAAQKFLTWDFRAPVDRRSRTRVAAERQTRPEVLEVLRAQQAALPPSAARNAALEALAAGGTAVVATGQQVGLFLGPLYGFYKAASAVAVARALEAEAGVRCVPLFWLQTEDHDFAEVASVTVAGSDGAPRRLTVAAEPSRPPRSSIAHTRLGPDVANALRTLADLLGDSPPAADTVALLARHYREGRTLAEAFAGSLADLFADDGLLFFQPRETHIGELAAPIHREAFTGAEAIERLLTARAEELNAAGFATQIPVRPRCALTFFHPDGAEGDRFRLARDEGAARWGLSGRAASLVLADLEAALARTPLCFSTSALLRPILQDTLFPTAAYVGGPAEVSYFAQLGPLYDRFGLTPPLVIPRARFRLLDAPTRRRLTALGLHADDIGRPPGELLARVAARATIAASGPDAEAVRRTVAGEILPLVDRLTAEVERASSSGAAKPDRNLARAALRTGATVHRALERLVTRLSHSAATRDEVALARLSRLEASLCPAGVPQERAYGWPSLAGRAGPQAFKRLVFQRLQESGPFSTGLLDIYG